MNLVQAWERCGERQRQRAQVTRSITGITEREVVEADKAVTECVSAAELVVTTPVLGRTWEQMICVFKAVSRRSTIYIFL